MMENIKLPIAVSIRVDDVGWFEGADDRHLGRPSRTGIPRRHVPDDILTLNAIGRGLGTKVLCNLVIGEWDFKNRLRGVPHETWDEAGWDAAKVVNANRAFFEGSFAALEDSEYLEYGLHGLLHGYYVDGMLRDEKFLYPFIVKDEKGALVRKPRDFGEFDRMLSLFFEIYNDWGFKKEIRVWEAGNGCYGKPSDDYNREFARILLSHGIGIWEWGAWPEDVLSQDGMVFINSALGFLEWNAYGVDPSILHNVFESPRGHGFVPNICGHLPNFIRFQPEKNFEYVDKWVDYFRRITRPFGAMIARDNEQSASQGVYAAYARVDTLDGGYRIDLTEVEKARTFILEDEFFVAIKDKRMPKQVEGGTLYVHEVRGDHVIYRIARNGASVVTITL